MTRVVIYVPGLGDSTPRQAAQSLLLGLWQPLYRIQTRYFAARWHNSPHEDFNAKLKRLLVMVDTELAQQNDVSLVGASAGASLALNAFVARPQVTAVVSVCGKLREPQTIADAVYARNPAFRPSIEAIMASEPTLSDDQRSRILLVRPQRDHVVPVGENWIGKAPIASLPLSGHALSILASITFFAPRIVRFIPAAKTK